MTALSSEFGYEQGAEKGFQPYRSISNAAVTGLSLAVISLAGFVFPFMLVFSAFGGIFSLIGWRNVARFPMELSGRIPAILGSVIGFGTLIIGIGYHSLIYATEVPEGFERVAFASLKAESKGPDVPPEEALALDGQRVFIKGYVYPGQQRLGIKRFVLVPDLGTCCFGGQPKLTHMIQVNMAGDLTVDYSMGKRKLAGVLRVSDTLKPAVGEDVGGVYYELQAEYVR